MPAVDAARRGPSSRPRFAIRSYPKEWERHAELRDGTKVLVRPVRPEDEPLYGPFFAAVTPQDLRLRFFAPVKELGHTFLARLLKPRRTLFRLRDDFEIVDTIQVGSSPSIFPMLRRARRRWSKG
jgi:hypothetical protein